MLKTILLIEDDNIVRIGLVRSLMDAGYIVVAATSSQSGLAEYSEREFDLVVSDNDCPREGAGLALLKELRARGQKVLLISERPVENLGNVPMMQKPFQGVEFAAKVRGLLGQ